MIRTFRADQQHQKELAGILKAYDKEKTVTMELEGRRR